MLKLKIALASRLPLYILIIGLMSINACKNKKKLTEVTDTEAVKAQIEQELEPATEEEVVPEKEPVVLKSNTKPPMTQSQQLAENLKNIAKAPNYNAANQTITQTLQMFSSPDAPVLIIIYESGAEVEYDEPTTISNYLNYLKDTKNEPAIVAEMGTDNAGKIKELVLRKK